ncbi:REP-associated tyrosine transposase [Pseudomonas sp. NPDC090755]|uniref:REP-associated tyrosine transposase n=1 Tax=Pseudomonas sp. NPDC090755 TaxID=3364481 RepID=UPI00383A9BCA
MRVHSKGYRLLTGRHSEPGQIYSVTVATHGRVPILGELPTGRLLVKELRLAHEEHLVCSLAWVVMPDHFHWLFALHGKCLSQVMCRVKSRSSLAINRARSGCGRLWQKGFYDRAIRKEEDLKTVARYIVANPVRAGLVQRVGDYPLWDASWL